MAREFKQQDSVQHRCPNCGAALTYDPADGKLRCEHCMSLVDFSKSHDVKERDFGELATFDTYKDGDITCYRCSNCGAESVVTRTSLATECPYCSSPVVIYDKTGSIVRPDSVIPFELTAEQAAAQLKLWSRRKWYAPRKFRKHTKAEAMKGVYVPAWTFDADTSSTYDGTLGYHRTRTVRRNGKTYTETYTEWRHVSGVMDAVFDDVFVLANGHIPDEYFRKLQPFSQDKYMVFDDEYLSGFIADHYTLQPLDAFARAKEQMLQMVRQRIVDRHNADVEGTLDVNMGIRSKSFKYILLPIYVASTKYNKKLYNQYVSGVYFNDEKKLARVAGKFPVSVWKVLATVLVGLGFIAALGYLFWSRGFFDNFFEGWEFAKLHTGNLLKNIWR